ncbi:hypothetical protein RHOFW510R12_26715 [Rhodanobacter sp. FW510-R12]|nr:MAG: hypothetical protein EPN35_03490 [Rhodanobacter sp.]
MSRGCRLAVAMAAVLGVGGCAQQAQVIRPSSAQLQALEPLPVVDVIDQDSLAAQDTFTAANINVVPEPGVPILAAAAGGALGMVIVNAAVKAEAERFAEAHVQPLRTALQGFDARSVLSDSLQQALVLQPTHFGNYTMTSIRPTSAARRLLVQTAYSMTPDFSALQVIVTVSIQDAGATPDQPVYRNVLVYQSERQVAPQKTAEDSQRMVTQENQRYSALHVDDDIAKANAEPNRRDSEAARLRTKINQEQVEHRQRLAQAALPVWDADTRAQHLANAWAANQGDALKTAMRASGAEIAHMLQLDLAGQIATDRIEQSRKVFSEGTREIDYVSGGRMVSMATGDADASLKKPSPMVMVPVNAAGRR